MRYTIWLMKRIRWRRVQCFTAGFGLVLASLVLLQDSSKNIGFWAGASLLIMGVISLSWAFMPKTYLRTLF